MTREHQLENIIYEAIELVESNFDNKLTVSDIYKILVKEREEKIC